MNGGAVHYESIMSGQQIFWICVAGIAGVTAVAVVPLIGLFWRAILRDVYRDAPLIALKADMVAAGFSAGDIQRVVRADQGDARAVDRPGPRRNRSENEPG